MQKRGINRERKKKRKGEREREREYSHFLSFTGYSFYVSMDGYRLLQIKQYQILFWEGTLRNALSLGL